MPGEGSGMLATKQEVPIKEDTLCGMDTFTIITKILHHKNKFGCTFIGDKRLRLEHNTPKDLQDKINSFYEKKKLSDDEDMIENDSTIDQSHKAMPIDGLAIKPEETKKNPE